MSLRYQSLTPGRRLGLAISVLVGLALVVLVPLVMLAVQIADVTIGLDDSQAQLRRQADQLDARRHELLAREASLGDARGLALAARDPASARAGFSGDVAMMAARLADAGATLDAEPNLVTTIEGDVRLVRVELSGVAGFEGLLVALARPELADLDIAGFDVVALAGTEPVRVRFAIEAIAYMPLSGEGDE